MDPTAAFLDAASAFCTFVEEASEARAVDVHAASRYLVALYQAALLLPEGVPGDDDLPSVDPPATWPGFGLREYYWLVFDPYVDDEPVVGLLSDDFLDIYRDVKPGVIAMKAGAPPAGRVGVAVWFPSALGEARGGGARGSACSRDDVSEAAGSTAL